MESAWFASRYDRGTPDYINCPMTEEEYNFVFGSHYSELKDRIICHDAKNSECINLGTSKNGTPMEVNKIAVDADRLVIITSVEPHYFAGYTGGRKSFLPGVASYRTIEANHKLAMKMEAQSLVLEGNPVHEDMMDALEVVKGKEIFSIQMVLDRHQNIYKVASGALNPAFDKAVGWANEVFSVPIPEKVDVVISVAPYPMDVDLYQSQKALDNGKWALKEGGKIIMVSKCREGIGHATFLTQLSSSKDPNKVLENLRSEYKLGYHKAAKMAEIATWASIWAVTDLDPELLRNANITPFPTVADAMAQAKHDAREGEIPVVAHRKDRCKWLVTLELDEFILRFYREWEAGPAQRLCEDVPIRRDTPYRGAAGRDHPGAGSKLLLDAGAE